MKTAYVLYHRKSRMYHVYTIISNLIDGSEHHDTPPPPPSSGADDVMNSGSAGFVLPEPQNTVQLKFTAYVSDTIVNYIMTLIIPSNDYDYYIQDDIVGVVSSNDDDVFGDECSFYDIEGLFYDNSSTLTTNGFNAFMLLPSRQFWYSSYFTMHSPSGAMGDNPYTHNTIDSALLILAQSN